MEATRLKRRATTFAPTSALASSASQKAPIPAAGGPTNGSPSRGGRSPLESFFLRRVAKEEVYNEFLTSLSLDTGYSEEVLESSLVPLCLCCWQQARSVIEDTEWTSDVNKLREQLQESQDKLAQCNLTSMKAISNLQAQVSGNYADDSLKDVTFHEPMAYLDPLMKELVMDIVVDKVNLIASGDAPPALLQQLMEAMARKAAAAAGDNEEEEDSDEDEGQQFRTRAQKLEAKRLKKEQDEIIRSRGATPAEVIARLEKALEESRRAESAASAKLEVVGCEEIGCSISETGGGWLIERLGIHLEHKEDPTPPAEVVRQRSRELAKRRLRELESAATQCGDASAPWNRQSGTQTELTGTWLNELLEASAELQASCSQVRENLGEAAAEDNKDGMNHRTIMKTRASFHSLREVLDKSVFVRMWKDVSLRDRGERQRHRAPAGPKAAVGVLRARALPPKPTCMVLPAVAGPLLPLHAVADRKVYFQQRAEEVPESEEDDEEAVEELDVQGVKVESPKSRGTVASESEDAHSPKSHVSEAPSPRLGSAWEPRSSATTSAKEDLPVLQGHPKFQKLERKTVSLALLGPSARTVAEAHLQKQLFSFYNGGSTEANPLPGRARCKSDPESGPLEATVSPRPRVPSMEVESVSDFLRQRRHAREVELSAPSVFARSSQATPPGGQVPSKRYLINTNRLEKSTSSPMLAHAA